MCYRKRWRALHSHAPSFFVQLQIWFFKLGEGPSLKQFARIQDVLGIKGLLNLFLEMDQRISQVFD